MECNYCKQTFEDSIEKNFIKEFGICLGCDKLRYEVEPEVEDDLEN